TETPFDFRERYTWNADKSQVLKHIEFGYPRLGRRQNELRFAQDENIDSLMSVGEDPETFATLVFVHGRGEGSAMAYGKAEKHIPGLLPGGVAIEAKTLDTKDPCQKVAAGELAKRSRALETRLKIGELTLAL